MSGIPCGCRSSLSAGSDAQRSDAARRQHAGQQPASLRRERRGLQLVATIPVGLDPVSVRARTNNEAWVVNHVSDSVSVVDLAQRRVIATLQTDDEPADVVFAG